MATFTKTAPFMIRGIAAYPKLNQPYSYDQAQRKSVVDPEKGSFSVEVIVDAEEAAKLQGVISDEAKQAGVRSMKNPPWTPEEDKTTGEPTGRVRFKCKGYGKRKDGSPNRISHFDAGARPMASDTRLTSGSDVRVQVSARPFTQLGGGCRLEILGVQVLRLVEASGPNPFSADPEFASAMMAEEDAPTFAEEASSDGPSLDF